MQVLLEAEAALPNPHDLKLPSRVLHLPMAWEDRWTREAMDK